MSWRLQNFRGVCLSDFVSCSQGLAEGPGAGHRIELAGLVWGCRHCGACGIWLRALIAPGVQPFQGGG